MGITSINVDDDILNRLKKESKIKGQSFSKYMEFKLREMDIDNSNNNNEIIDNNEIIINEPNIPTVSTEPDIIIRSAEEKINTTVKKPIPVVETKRNNDYEVENAVNRIVEKQENDKNFTELCNSIDCLKADVEKLKNNGNNVNNDKFAQMNDTINDKIIQVNNIINDTIDNKLNTYNENTNKNINGKIIEIISENRNDIKELLGINEDFNKFAKILSESKSRY